MIHSVNNDYKIIEKQLQFDKVGRLYDCNTQNIKQFSNMAKQIKLFQSFQKFHQMLGVRLCESNQSYSFNYRSVVILLQIIFNLTSSTAYSLFKAKTIEERVQSVYVSITELSVMITFSTMCRKMTNILQLIQKFEEFIQKSKFTIIGTLEYQWKTSCNNILYYTNFRIA